MARKRSPERDKAYEIFRKANGDIMNREIAKQLGISEKTVSGWKSKDKWLDKLNGVLQSNERSTPKENKNKGGAPPGNQNAKGNRGNSKAAAPKRNKNAVATGEFTTYYSDLLSEEQLAMLEEDVDSSSMLIEEINLLRIRQRDMYLLLKKANAGLTDVETQKLYELRGRKKVVESKKDGRKIKVETPDIVMTELKQKSVRKIDDILRIEEALTRVSKRLSDALKQFNDLSTDQLFVEPKLRELEAKAKIIEHTADKLVLDKEKQSQVLDLIEIGKQLIGGDTDATAE
ncbi:phage terminase small subunit [Vagococcus elongatus]|uniref:PBSX phage terminase small subunit-like N-terminal domain-containing protein n=1 Tax=Vagococcus elongatus TaxID=180344 RepID=A0A430AU39_9ENTE|nr:phage terminase small subunit [Vagococcus elongatus]RSU11579.1 hypothetical protein CBF29_07820 [Vagococcus elongatus]